jgi:hypothetical protein|tara:strand:+ start:436 stop:804 length:369 start_codon:yes stop_codon:yes gene_type:complete
MATHNWCHNPKCHTYHTTDRVRGSGDNKVLRTRRIKITDYQNAYYYEGWENHFCKVGCLMSFIRLHIDRIVAIAPVREPSETPIKVKKEKYETYNYQHDDNGGYHRVPRTATRTVIVGESND